MSRIIVEILLDGDNEFVRTKKVKTSSADRPKSLKNSVPTMEENDDQVWSGTEEPCLAVESAEEKALRIPPVVERVMHHIVRAGDLKNCRLVSNCWNLESTRVLVQRDCLEIRLESFRTSYAHVPHLSKGSGIKSHSGFTLANLNSLLGKIGESKFPVSSFTFIGGDLECVDAQTFFSNFGKRIKSLTILSGPFNKSLTSKSTLINILNRQAPNVDKLNLDLNVSFSFNTNLDDITLSPLLSLKCFIMPYPCHEEKQTVNNTTREVLRISSNLECLENVHVSQCRTIEEFGKTHLIQDLVDFGKVTQYCPIEDQMAFADLRPSSIRKLVIRWTSHQNQSRRDNQPEQENLKLSALQLLSACQHSLEYLKLGPGTSPFHNNGSPIKFPPMDKLRTLCLYKFRDNFQMNLRGPWPSVYHLEIKDCVKFNYLDKLGHLCPNVGRLTVFVKRNKNLDPLLLNVFRGMPKLRQLELFIVQYDHDFPNLDPIFTGLKPADCVNLHGRKPKIFNLVKNRIRKYWAGSIQGLKSIDIYFSSWTPRFRQHNISYNDHPLTEVSFLYGFDLLPSFRSLNIGYDKDKCASVEEHIKAAFDSMSPSLTVSSDLPDWMRK